MEGGYTEGDEFIGFGKTALEKAKGIEFIEGDWNRALEQARQENKLIFMDCYTSWCGPCKQLGEPCLPILMRQTFSTSIS